MENPLQGFLENAKKAYIQKVIKEQEAKRLAEYNAIDAETKLRASPEFEYYKKFISSKLETLDPEFVSLENGGFRVIIALDNPPSENIHSVLELLCKDLSNSNIGPSINLLKVSYPSNQVIFSLRYLN